MGIKDVENIGLEDMKPIALSFKKNEDELELYKWILGHSNFSGFIKDKLKEAKESELKGSKLQIDQAQPGLIDMDF
jgi:hypothetical protein